MKAAALNDRDRVEVGAAVRRVQVGVRACPCFYQGYVAGARSPLAAASIILLNSAARTCCRSS